MFIVVQDTGRSSRAIRKGKEATTNERETHNESQGGDGSEENSTEEYIRKLQAELAELKAAHDIASSSHTPRHREQDEKGRPKQGAQRYEMLALLTEDSKCYLLK